MHDLPHPCEACNASVREMRPGQHIPIPKRPDQPPMTGFTTVYVFWHKRPADARAWPVCYESQELAEACKFRVGPVIPVVMPGTPQQCASPQ
jgi:hypothetical protein